MTLLCPVNLEAIYRLIRLIQFIRDTEMALFLQHRNLPSYLVNDKNSTENVISHLNRKIEMNPEICGRENLFKFPFRISK